jgi:Flp pilus assembly protein TadG
MIRKPTLWRSESGATVVEMAVTMSVLLFLILGAVQFGLFFWHWNMMLLAAEEAGRYAMLYNPQTFIDLQSANLNLGQFCPGGGTLPQCAAAWAAKNWGNIYTITPTTTTVAGDPNTTYYTFTATYNFNFLYSFSMSRAIQVPVI